MKHNKERFLRLILLIALLVYYLCSVQNVLADEIDTNNTIIESSEDATKTEKNNEQIDESLNMDKEIIINETTKEESNEEIEEDETLKDSEEAKEELTREEILNNNSNGIVFDKEYATIYGNINEMTTTVSNIKENIDISNLTDNYGIKEINIIDESGNLLKEEDIVNNTNKIIIISQTFIASYNINFYKDHNEDNIITEKDVDFVIDSIIEKEETYTTEEVSYTDYIINNETFKLPEEQIQKEVQIEMTTPENTYTEEEIEVKYIIEPLNIDGRITISGQLNYDQELLKLTNIYIPENILINGKTQNNYFIYILENKEPIIITLKFIILKEGTTTIEINNISAYLNGITLTITPNINKTLTIYGKGGDIPLIETKPIINTNNNPSNNIIKTKEQNKENNKQSYITTTTISLNNDTYIKELKIEGYELDFNMEKQEYSIEVNKEINSLPLNILLNSNTSTYHIKGNNLNKEINKLTITIQAEDGSTRDYIINVTKKENNSNDKKTTKKNTNQHKNITYKIVPIILIILILTDIIYILRKREK